MTHGQNGIVASDNASLATCRGTGGSCIASGLICCPSVNDETLIVRRGTDTSKIQRAAIERIEHSARYCSAFNSRIHSAFGLREVDSLPIGFYQAIQYNGLRILEFNGNCSSRCDVSNASIGRATTIDFKSTTGCCKHISPSRQTRISPIGCPSMSSEAQEAGGEGDQCEDMFKKCFHSLSLRAYVLIKVQNTVFEGIIYPLLFGVQN